nr:MAG TPA: hypothetical protein [Microviridae sp.]
MLRTTERKPHEARELCKSRLRKSKRALQSKRVSVQRQKRWNTE